MGASLLALAKSIYYIIHEGCCVYSSSVKQCLPSVNHEQFIFGKYINEIDLPVPNSRFRFPFPDSPSLF